ncbi:MAG: hypothetical protein LBE89_00265 [Helicobacteraceae bacterium]|nr:hypothetical protein [Helicobacteraceae bacterium]
MKRIFIFFVWLIIFIHTAIFFLPKREIYFLAERILQEWKIAVNYEVPKDYGLLFSLKNPEFIYDKIPIATVESADLFVSLFYSSLSVSPFTLSSSLSFLPPRVDSLRVRHTIFAPHVVYIDGAGAFGEFSGTINLLDRRASILLQSPSEIQGRYPLLFREMNKTQEGFVYERAF